jgi:hypothetical protein
MKKLLFTMMVLFLAFSAQAQTEEELKAEMGPKKDSIAAIQGRVDALQAQIDALPGWKKGAFGTIGANLSSFNNWFAQGIPNNESGNIGFTLNAFANLKQDKFFWRNSLTTNFNWVKLDDKDDPTDNSDFRQATDVFTLSSLYGHKLSEKFAISALGEYRTTVLSNFNDPGYLDLGVGATWTPIQDMVVVIHPLNYNFVFASEGSSYESSMGAKIVVDYTRQIGAVSFKTNFSTFQSYKSGDYSNWTWTNSFGYMLWKMIGVGFDFGLRSNLQEAINIGGLTDNKTQSYWTLGVNYAF